jgi:hypothetical protein
MKMLSLYLWLAAVGLILTGCALKRYDIVERTPHGEVINTISVPYSNAKRAHKCILNCFRKGRYDDAALHGKAFLEKKGVWKISEDQLSEVYIVLIYANLFLVKDSEELRDVYVNNGHIKEALDSLEKLTSSGNKCAKCFKQLDAITRHGSFHEEAFYAFLKFIEKYTVVARGRVLVEKNPGLTRDLEEIRRNYRKWYEDYGVQRWIECHKDAG